MTPLSKGDEPPTDISVRRRARRDGERNRARLLDLARDAFGSGEVDLKLDELARRAGVGIGTLYRHFPSRDALVEAVYAAEVDALAAAAERLAATEAPAEAVRSYMRLFVDYLARKRLVAPALRAMVGGASPVFERSGTLVKASIRALVDRAVAAGEMRADVDAVDLLRALVGVADPASGPGREEAAKRLVDVLVAGSRPWERPIGTRRR